MTPKNFSKNFKERTGQEKKLVTAILNGARIILINTVEDQLVAGTVKNDPKVTIYNLPDYEQTELYP